MPALGDNTRGALLMTGSMAAFTLNDACMKAIGADVPLFQALLIRGIGTSLLLYGLARFMGSLRFDMSRRDWHLAFWRCLGEAGAAYFFISALFEMPIANVSAILQTLPLCVALGAALFLGEPLGWRRVTAIVIGFLGVLLVIRPGPEGFNLYAVYALLSVFCVTLRELATRRMSPGIPSLTIAFLTAVAVTLFAAAGAAFEDFVPLTARHGVLFAATILFVLGGYLFSVMAIRVGEIAVVAPFRYTSLLVALLLGLVFFGEWPTTLTLLGCAIIVATGLFTLYREQKLRISRGRATLPR